MDTLSEKDRAAAEQVARRRYCTSDEVEIDWDVAKHPENFSSGDNGTWVRAWVWVDGQDLGWSEKED